jgi:hypothetical protein
MFKNSGSSFLLAILFATLPTTGWAQDAKTVLTKTIWATGIVSVRVLEYSGSGSNWDEKGQHSPLNSYKTEIVLNLLPSGAPWSEEIEYWITPYGFLRGALANNSTVEAKSVYGAAYQIVTFSLPGNHKVVGYINGNNLVERVQTTTDDGVAVEGIYRDYADFRGLKAPTTLIRNRGGMLFQVVIIKDAKVTGI